MAADQETFRSAQEAICIHVGQGGVQIGNAVWEQLSGEHEVYADGFLKLANFENTVQSVAMQTFFEPTLNGTYCPRALMVDLEPTVIDEIRTGYYRNLFHPDRLINSTEDAANTYARGYYSNGKLIQLPLRDQLRHMIEECDHLVSFMLFRTLGGGTGSGTTSIIFDILEEYSKKTRIGFSVYPSPQMGASILEPYNSIMTSHESVEGLDMEILLDNQTLYNICTKKLEIPQPTYRHINQIIAQAANCATACNRYPNMLYGDLNTVSTNLVPYPRIHFVLTALAPFASGALTCHERLNAVDVTKSVFKPCFQLVDCDSDKGKYMSCCLIYRGNCNPREAYNAIDFIKSNKLIEFVDWVPTGFKLGICPEPAATVSHGVLKACALCCFMMTNNTAIGHTLKRTSYSFKKLYSKRAFVYWYVSEGMEENDFSESLDDLFSIVKDYTLLDQDMPETVDEESVQGEQV